MDFVVYDLFDQKYPQKRRSRRSIPALVESSQAKLQKDSVTVLCAISTSARFSFDPLLDKASDSVCLSFQCDSYALISFLTRT